MNEKKLRKFKLNPKYPHHRSEGLTRRGQKRLARLLGRTGDDK